MGSGDYYAESKLAKVKRIISLVLAGILVVLVLGTVLGSFYMVSEQQNAVVTMFGEVIRTDTVGLHWKVPFLQSVRKVDISTHGTGIGYTVDKKGQNIVNDDEGIMITSDFNFINIDFYMEYRVTDPVAYLYNSENPEEVLKNIALACIRSTVIDYTVDEAMTTGKPQIQADVKAKINDALALRNIGLYVTNITVQDAEPPTNEIIAEFKAVETAKQGMETVINNANKYRNEQIPAAEAEADRILQDAEATKEARIAEAEGQVSRFNAMYEQFRQYPLITKQRMFYEALEDVLPGLKVYITDGNTDTMLPLESFSTTGNGGNVG